MKTRRIYYVAALLAIIDFFTGRAKAACEDALILSTYSEATTFKSDWRLAILVSKEAYKELSQRVGVNGSIYGVPVGASYEDFKKNYEKLVQRYAESLTQEQAKQIVWTGLDPNASNAYTACLQNQIFNSHGLHMAVVQATETNVLLKVRWFVPGNPTPARVTWTVPSIGDKALPVDFPQGDTIISVPRPSGTIALAANFEGNATEAVTLSPLPKDPPRKVERSCKEYRSLAGKDSEVACNVKTDVGYYWKVIKSRIGPYFEGGAVPTGLPACGANELGETGFTTRYPPAHSFFLDVGSTVVTGGAPHKDSFNCNPGSTVDLRPICGKFTVVCSKQED